MSNYFIKRILLFIPAVFLVLFFTMVMGHYAGETPAHLLQNQNRGQYSEKQKETIRKKLGLDEPFFYFKVRREQFSSIYYPAVVWNGKKNRFHRYLHSIFDGSLGYSSYYKSEVWQVIKLPLLRTLAINILATIIVYSLGLLLGYFQALNQKSRLSGIFETLGHIFYAIPNFWLALLLLWLLSNRQMLHIFPGSGWYWNENEFWLESLSKLSFHLVLPIICLVSGAIIFISSIFRQKLSLEMKKPYFTSLRSRGFSEAYILKKYVLKVALIPVISVSTSVLPALISGSVIIESIFSIPGLGKMAFSSFFTRDLQVIYAITLITSILTWLNWILADYMYSRLDPRISWK